jgi:hypothetical protein
MSEWQPIERVNWLTEQMAKAALEVATWPEVKRRRLRAEVASQLRFERPTPPDSEGR